MGFSSLIYWTNCQGRKTRASWCSISQVIKGCAVYCFSPGFIIGMSLMTVFGSHFNLLKWFCVSILLFSLESASLCVRQLMFILSGVRFISCWCIVISTRALVREMPCPYGGCCSTNNSYEQFEAGWPQVSSCWLVRSYHRTCPVATEFDTCFACGRTLVCMSLVFHFIPWIPSGMVFPQNARRSNILYPAMSTMKTFSFSWPASDAQRGVSPAGRRAPDISHACGVTLAKFEIWHEQFTSVRKFSIWYLLVTGKI